MIHLILNNIIVNIVDLNIDWILTKLHIMVAVNILNFFYFDSLVLIECF